MWIPQDNSVDFSQRTAPQELDDDDAERAAEIMQKPVSISQVQAILKKYLSDEAKAPAVNYPLPTGQTINVLP